MTRLQMPFRRGARMHTRGQALVEVALILPVFILVLVGIFDLGRAVYAFNTLSNSAREAARVGIVNQSTAVVSGHAIQHAVALGLDAGDVELAFLTPDLSATCSAPVALGCVVEVTVHYEFVPATPILSNLIGSLDLSSTAREPVERTYQSP
ncbi:MAG TPA: TadE/TadG family type IV pilus assembly protein [Candidatus Limnocylindria bacterium]|nr:TadE/TadG family type IV pilus assembly protein [Candidatus Limnocylindria bacterium]